MRISSALMKKNFEWSKNKTNEKKKLIMNGKTIAERVNEF